MRKYRNQTLIAFLSLAMMFQSCKKEEIKNYEGGSYVSFNETAGNLSVVADPGIDTFKIEVGVTKSSSEDRSYTFTIDDASTAVEGTHFTLLSNEIVVPANSFIGELLVVSNFDDLPTPPGSVSLVLNIDSTAEFVDFRQSFALSIRASCPSDLAGVYDAVSNATSTDPNVTNTPLVNFPFEITLTATGTGTYESNSATGGVYVSWYGGLYTGYQDNAIGTISDLCNEISVTAVHPDPGSNVAGSGAVDPATGVITYTWSNSYGDEGTIVLTPR